MEALIQGFLEEDAVRLVQDYFHARLPDDDSVDPGGPLFTGARTSTGSPTMIVHQVTRSPIA